jgi:hypothetical protein
MPAPCHQHVQVVCRWEGGRFCRPAAHGQVPDGSLLSAARSCRVFTRTLRRLTTSRCNFGGERFWFRCPTCDRRTRSIFIVGPPFQCRVCLRLRYQSQRERLAARFLSKAIRLSKRLEGTGDAFSFGSKPKGMHQRTYKRLIVELENLRWRSTAA